MRAVFLPALLHQPTGDPGLWVDLLDEGRSLLLDAGDLSHMPVRKLTRVERLVVTHTHMDHFAGFDRLLRVCLGRERELVVTGPAGFLGRLRGRIAAYTWNVIHDYPIRLRAEEVDHDAGVVRSELYTGPSGMTPQPLPERPFHGVLHGERLFTLHVDALDHGVTVLGAALRETEHVSINKDRVLRLGLEPGAWLRELKQAVRRCDTAGRSIEAATRDGGTRRFAAEELAGEIVMRSAGQRLAYITDIRGSAENLARAGALAQDADLLVCEAAFLHEDRRLADERGHLTARQAGELARAAGARRLAPFHLSPRYQGRERELLDEAAEAFGAPILELTRVGTG